MRREDISKNLQNNLKINILGWRKLILSILGFLIGQRQPADVAYASGCGFLENLIRRSDHVQEELSVKKKLSFVIMHFGGPSGYFDKYIQIQL